MSSKLKRYSILSLEMLQSITVFLLVFTMMKGNYGKNKFNVNIAYKIIENLLAKIMLNCELH